LTPFLLRQSVALCLLLPFAKLVSCVANCGTVTIPLSEL